MTKILIWIGVIFVLLFGLRLLNVAKAKRRSGHGRTRPGVRTSSRNDGPLRRVAASTCRSRTPPRDRRA